MKMRLRSPEYRGCSKNLKTSAGLANAAVVVALVGLGGGAGISQSAAGPVAYVEAVRGRVIAMSRGTPHLLDALDSIGDRTRLDLQTNSELRICHYPSGQLLTLRGPLRVSVSADRITAENGKPIDRPAGSCAVPVVSKFQGGLVSRGLASDADAAPPRRRR
jgi:hypothetical protein